MRVVDCFVGKIWYGAFLNVHVALWLDYEKVCLAHVASSEVP